MKNFIFLILSIFSIIFSNSLQLCNNYIKCDKVNYKEEYNTSLSSSASDSLISLNLKSTAYTNEIIEIDGIASRKYKIVTSSKKINLIEARIDDTSNILLKFKINSYDSNVVFDFINDNNEIVGSKTLFLYKTDLGTFISQVSNQINIDNYKAQQLNENLISTIEYDEYNATRNIDSAIETPLKKDIQIHKPLQIATLYGYLKWTNNKGITFPLKNTYIELIGVCFDSGSRINYEVKNETK